MYGYEKAGRRHGGVRVMLIAAVCVMLAATFALAQGANDEDGKSATVTIDNFSFSPEILTIKPGTKVTFVNHDDIPHTVVAVNKAFKSRAMDTDDTYEFTFTTAGDFDYFCGLHPHMKAKIIVLP